MKLEYENIRILEYSNSIETFLRLPNSYSHCVNDRLCGLGPFRARVPGSRESGDFNVELVKTAWVAPR